VEVAVHLIELTIPFETGMEAAATCKGDKYADLVTCCKVNGYRANLHTIEVGSRGFLHSQNFLQLYKIVKADCRLRGQLEKEVISRVIEASFQIWCQLKKLATARMLVLMLCNCLFDNAYIVVLLYVYLMLCICSGDPNCIIVHVCCQNILAALVHSFTHLSPFFTSSIYTMY
jgi:hypothetical protein